MHVKSPYMRKFIPQSIRLFRIVCICDILVNNWFYRSCDKMIPYYEGKYRIDVMYLFIYFFRQNTANY